MLSIASLRNNHIGVGKDTVRTNRTIELIRVMAFGEVNHKINIAILKMLLAKVLLFFSLLQGCLIFREDYIIRVKVTLQIIELKCDIRQ